MFLTSMLTAITWAIATGFIFFLLETSFDIRRIDGKWCFTQVKLNAMMGTFIAFVCFIVFLPTHYIDSRRAASVKAAVSQCEKSGGTAAYDTPINARAENVVCFTDKIKSVKE